MKIKERSSVMMQFGKCFIICLVELSDLSLLTKKYKKSSFKSSENFQKKECGPDRSVSDNRSSSVTLNKLAMKARKSNCNFKFKHRSHTMTDIKPNEVKII